MRVEIGAERGDVLHRLDQRQKAEIGARRPDRLDQRQLTREPRGERRQRRFERRVGGDLAPLRGAGDPAHHKKRLAEDSRIGAGPERLGYTDPSGEHRLQHGEFLDPSEARRDPGRRVGAQDEALPAGERSAGELGVEAPILLDRPAGQQLQPVDPDPARPARLGQEATQQARVHDRH